MNAVENANLKQETKELLIRQPEWAPILISCVQFSRESADGVLDGSAVRNRAQMFGWSLVPLLTLGILEKAGPARKHGHVGINRMRDVQAVENALTELGYDVHAKLPGDFFAQHEKWLHRTAMSAMARSA
ncbi:MAG TPA: hypothetical protein VIO10_04090 [Candidatus Binatus sp.]